MISDRHIESFMAGQSRITEALEHPYLLDDPKHPEWADSKAEAHDSR